MDFGSMLAELIKISEEYKSKKTDDANAAVIYCAKFARCLQTLEDEKTEYEDKVTSLFMFLTQLSGNYPLLPDTPAKAELCQEIFVLCAKIVLNVKWQQLDENCDAKKNFMITLDLTHQQLSSQGFDKLGLVMQLIESHWTHPVLSAIMGGDDDIDEEEALNYIKSEDPVILRIRVEMLLKENCAEFASNLCTWVSKHPLLKEDIDLRKLQLILLHKSNNVDKIQEQCQIMSCHLGVKLISYFEQREENQKLCVLLAQTFLIQDWIRDSKRCCTKELLKLWIRHQYLVDSEESKFIDSVWAVAKLSSGTDQIGILIEMLRRECGNRFLQLYIDLCVYAINLDKGTSEEASRNNDGEIVVQRKRDMSKTCERLTVLLWGVNAKVMKFSALTAYSLDPSMQRMEFAQAAFLKNMQEPPCLCQSDSKGKSILFTTPQESFSTTCTVCELKTTVKTANADLAKQVNMATLYEVERLLNMLRPNFLNPDADWSSLEPVSTLYLIMTAKPRFPSGLLNALISSSGQLNLPTFIQTSGLVLNKSDMKLIDFIRRIICNPSISGNLKKTVVAVLKKHLVEQGGEVILQQPQKNIQETSPSGQVMTSLGQDLRGALPGHNIQAIQFSSNRPSTNTFSRNQSLAVTSSIPSRTHVSGIHSDQIGAPRVAFSNPLSSPHVCTDGSRASASVSKTTRQDWPSRTSARSDVATPVSSNVSTHTGSSSGQYRFVPYLPNALPTAFSNVTSTVASHNIKPQDSKTSMVPKVVSSISLKHATKAPQANSDGLSSISQLREYLKGSPHTSVSPVLTSSKSKATKNHPELSNVSNTSHVLTSINQQKSRGNPSFSIPSPRVAHVQSTNAHVIPSAANHRPQIIAPAPNKQSIPPSSNPCAIQSTSLTVAQNVAYPGVNRAPITYISSNVNFAPSSVTSVGTMINRVRQELTSNQNVTSVSPVNVVQQGAAVLIVSLPQASGSSHQNSGLAVTANNIKALSTAFQSSNEIPKTKLVQQPKKRKSKKPKTQQELEQERLVSLKLVESIKKVANQTIVCRANFQSCTTTSQPSLNYSTSGVMNLTTENKHGSSASKSTMNQSGLLNSSICKVPFSSVSVNANAASAMFTKRNCELETLPKDFSSQSSLSNMLQNRPSLQNSPIKNIPSTTSPTLTTGSNISAKQVISFGWDEVFGNSKTRDVVAVDLMKKNVLHSITTNDCFQKKNQSNDIFATGNPNTKKTDDFSLSSNISTVTNGKKQANTDERKIGRHQIDFSDLQSENPFDLDVSDISQVPPITEAPDDGKLPELETDSVNEILVEKMKDSGNEYPSLKQDEITDKDLVPNCSKVLSNVTENQDELITQREVETELSFGNGSENCVEPHTDVMKESVSSNQKSDNSSIHEPGTEIEKTDQQGFDVFDKISAESVDGKCTSENQNMYNFIQNQQEHNLNKDVPGGENVSSTNIQTSIFEGVDTSSLTVGDGSVEMHESIGKGSPRTVTNTDQENRNIFHILEDEFPLQDKSCNCNSLESVCECANLNALETNDKEEETFFTPPLCMDETQTEILHKMIESLNEFCERLDGDKIEDVTNSGSLSDFCSEILPTSPENGMSDNEKSDVHPTKGDVSDITVASATEQEKITKECTQKNYVIVYRCILCLKLFETEKQLKEHVMSGCKPSLDFISYYNQLNLQKNPVGDISQEIVLYKCSECEHTFKTKRLIVNHFNESLKRLAKRKLKQEQESKLEENPSLQDHPAFKSQGSNQFECKLCGVSYLTSGPYKTHLGRYHGIENVEEYLETCSTTLPPAVSTCVEKRRSTNNFSPTVVGTCEDEQEQITLSESQLRICDEKNTYKVVSDDTHARSSKDEEHKIFDKTVNKDISGEDSHCEQVAHFNLTNKSNRKACSSNLSTDAQNSTGDKTCKNSMELVHQSKSEKSNAEQFRQYRSKKNNLQSVKEKIQKAKSVVNKKIKFSVEKKKLVEAQGKVVKSEKESALCKKSGNKKRRKVPFEKKKPHSGPKYIRCNTNDLLITATYFYCKCCEDRFYNSCNLLRHYVMKHLQCYEIIQNVNTSEKKENLRVKCLFCEKKFPSIKPCMNHAVGHYEKVMRLSCLSEKPFTSRPRPLNKTSHHKYSGAYLSQKKYKNPNFLVKKSEKKIKGRSLPYEINSKRHQRKAKSPRRSSRLKAPGNVHFYGETVKPFDLDGSTDVEKSQTLGDSLKETNDTSGGTETSQEESVSVTEEGTSYDCKNETETERTRRKSLRTVISKTPSEQINATSQKKKHSVKKLSTTSATHMMDQQLLIKVNSYDSVPATVTSVKSARKRGRPRKYAKPLLQNTSSSESNEFKKMENEGQHQCVSEKFFPIAETISVVKSVSNSECTTPEQDVAAEFVGKKQNSVKLKNAENEQLLQDSSDCTNVENSLPLENNKVCEASVIISHTVDENESLCVEDFSVKGKKGSGSPTSANDKVDTKCEVKHRRSKTLAKSLMKWKASYLSDSESEMSYENPRRSKTRKSTGKYYSDSDWENTCTDSESDSECVKPHRTKAVLKPEKLKDTSQVVDKASKKECVSAQIVDYSDDSKGGESHQTKAGLKPKDLQDQSQMLEKVSKEEYVAPVIVEYSDEESNCIVSSTRYDLSDMISSVVSKPENVQDTSETSKMASEEFVAPLIIEYSDESSCIVSSAQYDLSDMISSAVSKPESVQDLSQASEKASKEEFVSPLSIEYFDNDESSCIISSRGYGLSDMISSVVAETSEGGHSMPEYFSDEAQFEISDRHNLPKSSETAAGERNAGHSCDVTFHDDNCLPDTKHIDDCKVSELSEQNAVSNSQFTETQQLVSDIETGKIPADNDEFSTEMNSNYKHQSSLGGTEENAKVMPSITTTCSSTSDIDKQSNDDGNNTEHLSMTIKPLDNVTVVEDFTDEHCDETQIPVNNTSDSEAVECIKSDNLLNQTNDTSGSANVTCIKNTNVNDSVGHFESLDSQICSNQFNRAFIDFTKTANNLPSDVSSDKYHTAFMKFAESSRSRKTDEFNKAFVDFALKECDSSTRNSYNEKVKNEPSKELVSPTISLPQKEIMPLSEHHSTGEISKTFMEKPSEDTKNMTKNNITANCDTNILLQKDLSPDPKHAEKNPISWCYRSPNYLDAFKSFVVEKTTPRKPQLTADIMQNQPDKNKQETGNDLQLITQPELKRKEANEMTKEQKYTSGEKELTQTLKVKVVDCLNTSLLKKDCLSKGKLCRVVIDKLPNSVSSSVNQTNIDTSETKSESSSDEEGSDLSEIDKSHSDILPNSSDQSISSESGPNVCDKTDENVETDPLNLCGDINHNSGAEYDGPPATCSPELEEVEIVNEELDSDIETGSSDLKSSDRNELLDYEIDNAFHSEVHNYQAPDQHQSSSQTSSFETDTVDKGVSYLHTLSSKSNGGKLENADRIISQVESVEDVNEKEPTDVKTNEAHDINEFSHQNIINTDNEITVEIIEGQVKLVEEPNEEQKNDEKLNELQDVCKLRRQHEPSIDNLSEKITQSSSEDHLQLKAIESFDSFDINDPHETVNRTVSDAMKVELSKSTDSTMKTNSDGEIKTSTSDCGNITLCEKNEFKVHQNTESELDKSSKEQRTASCIEGNAETQTLNDDTAQKDDPKQISQCDLKIFDSDATQQIVNYSTDLGTEKEPAKSTVCTADSAACDSTNEISVVKQSVPSCVSKLSFNVFESESVKLANENTEIIKDISDSATCIPEITPQLEEADCEINDPQQEETTEVIKMNQLGKNEQCLESSMTFTAEINIDNLDCSLGDVENSVSIQPENLPSKSENVTEGAKLSTCGDCTSPVLETNHVENMQAALGIVCDSPKQEKFTFQKKKRVLPSSVNNLENIKRRKVDPGSRDSVKDNLKNKAKKYLQRSTKIMILKNKQSPVKTERTLRLRTRTVSMNKDSAQCEEKQIKASCTLATDNETLNAGLHDNPVVLDYDNIKDLQFTNMVASSRVLVDKDISFKKKSILPMNSDAHSSVDDAQTSLGETTNKREVTRKIKKDDVPQTFTSRKIKKRNSKTRAMSLVHSWIFNDKKVTSQENQIDVESRSSKHETRTHSISNQANSQSKADNVDIKSDKSDKLKITIDKLRSRGKSAPCSELKFKQACINTEHNCMRTRDHVKNRLRARSKDSSEICNNSLTNNSFSQQIENFQNSSPSMPEKDVHKLKTVRKNFTTHVKQSKCLKSSQNDEQESTFVSHSTKKRKVHHSLQNHQQKDLKKTSLGDQDNSRTTREFDGQNNSKKESHDRSVVIRSMLTLRKRRSIVMDEGAKMNSHSAKGKCDYSNQNKSSVRTNGPNVSVRQRKDSTNLSLNEKSRNVVLKKGNSKRVAQLLVKKSAYSSRKKIETSNGSNLIIDTNLKKQTFGTAKIKKSKGRKKYISSAINQNILNDTISTGGICELRHSRLKAKELNVSLPNHIESKPRHCRSAGNIGSDKNSLNVQSELSCSATQPSTVSHESRFLHSDATDFDLFSSKDSNFEPRNLRSNESNKVTNAIPSNLSNIKSFTSELNQSSSHTTQSGVTELDHSDNKRSLRSSGNDSNTLDVDSSKNRCSLSLSNNTLNQSRDNSKDTEKLKSYAMNSTATGKPSLKIGDFYSTFAHETRRIKHDTGRRSRSYSGETNKRKIENQKHRLRSASGNKCVENSKLCEFVSKITTSKKSTIDSNEPRGRLRTDVKMIHRNKKSIEPDNEINRIEQIKKSSRSSLSFTNSDNRRDLNEQNDGITAKGSQITPLKSGGRFSCSNPKTSGNDLNASFQPCLMDSITSTIARDEANYRVLRSHDQDNKEHTARDLLKSNTHSTNEKAAAETCEVKQMQSSSEGSNDLYFRGDNGEKTEIDVNTEQFKLNSDTPVARKCKSTTSQGSDIASASNSEHEQRILRSSDKIVSCKSCQKFSPHETLKAENQNIKILCDTSKITDSCDSTEHLRLRSRGSTNTVKRNLMKKQRSASEEISISTTDPLNSNVENDASVIHRAGAKANQSSLNLNKTKQNSSSALFVQPSNTSNIHKTRRSRSSSGGSNVSTTSNPDRPPRTLRSSDHLKNNETNKKNGKGESQMLDVNDSDKKFTKQPERPIIKKMSISLKGKCKTSSDKKENLKTNNSSTVSSKVAQKDRFQKSKRSRSCPPKLKNKRMMSTNETKKSVSKNKSTNSSLSSVIYNSKNRNHMFDRKKVGSGSRCTFVRTSQKRKKNVSCTPACKRRKIDKKIEVDQFDQKGKSSAEHSSNNICKSTQSKLISTDVRVLEKLEENVESVTGIASLDVMTDSESVCKAERSDTTSTNSGTSLPENKSPTFRPPILCKLDSSKTCSKRRVGRPIAEYDMTKLVTVSSSDFNKLKSNPSSYFKNKVNSFKKPLLMSSSEINFEACHSDRDVTNSEYNDTKDSALRKLREKTTLEPFTWNISNVENDNSALKRLRESLETEPFKWDLGSESDSIHFHSPSHTSKNKTFSSTYSLNNADSCISDSESLSSFASNYSADFDCGHEDDNRIPDCSGCRRKHLDKLYCSYIKAAKSESSDEPESDGATKSVKRDATCAKPNKPQISSKVNSSDESTKSPKVLVRLKEVSSPDRKIIAAIKQMEGKKGHILPRTKNTKIKIFRVAGKNEKLKSAPVILKESPCEKKACPASTNSPLSNASKNYLKWKMQQRQSSEGSYPS